MGMKKMIFITLLLLACWQLGWAETPLEKEKQAWDDIERKSVDPKFPPALRQNLAEKVKLHQQVERKRKADEIFRTLGTNFLNFHGYRLYPNNGVYDGDANLIYGCNNYQCMYTWTTNKLLELIKDPNVSQVDRQALTLEHQQLVAEYQVKETERLQKDQLEQAQKLQNEQQRANDERTAKTLLWQTWNR